MKKLFKHFLVTVLTFEAKIALKRHNPRIIAITGNVGKTSTKDAIYAVVQSAFSVRKSEKSFNSEIGLPLAILGLDTAWSSIGGWLKNIWHGALVAFSRKPFPEWLVLEVGADHPGDIRKIGEWLHPDITVLTRMSEVPVHVEFFKDAEEVLAEKMELVKALKDGGTVVANADDPIFMKALALVEVKKVLYGKDKKASSRILESEVIYGNDPLGLPQGQYSIVEGEEGIARIELSNVLGEHSMYPIAAAHAVAELLDIAEHVEEALNNFETPRGRMRLLLGKSSSVIIDDTYNSSPIAVVEALKTLGSLSTRGRKIAVLGEMRELGDNAEKAHRDVGAFAALHVHTLVISGENARLFATGALDAGLASDRIVFCEDAREAGRMLADFVRAGDVVLVKGSQGARMERAVELVLADTVRANECLVRQDREWKERV